MMEVDREDRNEPREIWFDWMKDISRLPRITPHIAPIVIPPHISAQYLFLADPISRCDDKKNGLSRIRFGGVRVAEPLSASR
jgi:hypothetical protein